MSSTYLFVCTVRIESFTISDGVTGIKYRLWTVSSSCLILALVLVLILIGIQVLKRGRTYLDNVSGSDNDDAPGPANQPANAAINTVVQVVNNLDSEAHAYETNLSKRRSRVATSVRYFLVTAESTRRNTLLFKSPPSPSAENQTPSSPSYPFGHGCLSHESVAEINKPYRHDTTSDPDSPISSGGGQNLAAKRGFVGNGEKNENIQRGNGQHTEGARFNGDKRRLKKTTMACDFCRSTLLSFT